MHIHHTIAFVALALAFLPASAQERKIQSKDVPRPVLESALRSFPQAKLDGWEKETDGGKALYEVSMIEGASRRQATFTSDGSLVETEEAVDLMMVPASVRDSIRSKYPRAVIQGAEKVTRGSTVEYELALQKAPKKEIVLTPDGRILKEE